MAEVTQTQPNSVEVSVQVSRQTETLLRGCVGFAAGAAYGLTSVVVGQPLDTIKTRMQARPDSCRKNAFRVAIDLGRSQGLPGLYRGGLPVFLGGTMFRSAQFGFYELTLKHLRAGAPEHKFFGILDWQVALAGVAGGLARGVIEAPFDLVKVTRQVEQKWSKKSLFEGSSVTLARNAGLFCCFSIYRDIIPPLIPGGLSPFWMGALCSNLAWLTVWPLDVIKSQRQSGNYKGRNSWALLMHASRSGTLFRGVVPGIARSTVANGCAMVAYKKLEQLAEVQLPQWR